MQYTEFDEVMKILDKAMFGGKLTAEEQRQIFQAALLVKQVRDNYEARTREQKA